MAKKFTFDELLAKRERREADRLKIGMLTVLGSEYGLEARMPSQKTVLDLYGELVAASDAKGSLLCGNHAVYACCPQLWDKKLQEALGCQDDPMRVLDDRPAPSWGRPGTPGPPGASCPKAGDSRHKRRDSRTGASPSRRMPPPAPRTGPAPFSGWASGPPGRIRCLAPSASRFSAGPPPAAPVWPIVRQR